MSDESWEKPNAFEREFALARTRSTDGVLAPAEASNGIHVKWIVLWLVACAFAVGVLMNVDALEAMRLSFERDQSSAAAAVRESSSRPGSEELDDDDDLTIVPLDYSRDIERSKRRLE